MAHSYGAIHAKSIHDLIDIQRVRSKYLYKVGAASLQSKFHSDRSDDMEDMSASEGQSRPGAGVRKHLYTIFLSILIVATP